MGKKGKKHFKEEAQEGHYTGYHEAYVAPEHRGWGFDIQMCTLSAAVLLGIYLRTVYRSVPGGDSGELIVSAHEWGVAHPPGYPLFTLTAKLAMLYLPGGSPAWRVNALNAFYCAVAGGLLQLTVLRLTGCHGSAIFALGLFSLSKLTWTWSASAEVFGLNNMLIAAIMLMTVVFEMAEEVPKIKKSAYFGSFLCGLALTNQHTSVIYVACIALWVLYRLSKYQLLSPGSLLSLCACFCLGLLPYVHLPLSARLAEPRWTWGDQSSLAGFVKHLLRAEYGTFDLGKGSEGLGFAYGLRSYLEHVYSNHCEIGPFLALIGAISTVNRKGKGEGSLFVFIIMLSAYASFFAWRANLDLSDNLMRGVVERFWLQSDLVMAVLAAYGFHTTVWWLTARVLGEKKSSLAIVFAVIAAVSVVALQLRNFESCDYSKNSVVRDFAATILEKLPRDAIVFTKGDLPTNSMRYLHLVERVRPDLELVDVEIMSYEWSHKVRQHFKRIQFPGDYWHLTNRVQPDGRKSFNFKALIDSNYNRAPLFVCIGMQDKDASWHDGGYTLLPHGVCHQIVDSRADFDPDDWANRTGGFAHDWHYAWDSYPATSWEKVANDEMWHAKISTAFFLYEQAERADSDAARARLLTASYRLYFDAIRRNQVSSRMNHREKFPSFWHKNFALVLERMLHVDVPIPKFKVCKQSISHFQQYVTANPSDPDSLKILEAVESLKSRLPTYEQWDASMRKVDEVTRRYTGQT